MLPNPDSFSGERNTRAYRGLNRWRWSDIRFREDSAYLFREDSAYLAFQTLLTAHKKPDPPSGGVRLCQPSRGWQAPCQRSQQAARVSNCD